MSNPSPKQLQQEGAAIGTPMIYTANGWAPQPNGATLTAQGPVSIQNGTLNIGDTGSGATAFYSNTQVVYGHKVLTNNTVTTFATISVPFGGNFAQCSGTGEMSIRWTAFAGQGADPFTGGAAGQGTINFSMATSYAGSNSLSSPGYVAGPQVVINSSEFTFNSAAFSIVSVSPGQFALHAQISITTSAFISQITLDWDAKFCGFGASFGAA